MLKVINYTKKNSYKKLEKFLNKRRGKRQSETSTVIRILNDIKKNKLIAVKKYERKFSSNNIIYPSIREINQAINSLDKKVKKSIDKAYLRILKFHKLQKPKDIKLIDKYKNKIEYKNIPLPSIGIYVPSNLPSSLSMNAIPARLAKIKNIYLSNPRIKSKLDPAVMYAAKKCGIKPSRIISVGGAQAIGHLAYIDKCSKIVGPGNLYVASAKKIVSDDVGTESILAGPSEVTVIADKFSNINQVLLSLLAQSEHDKNCQSILITNDKKLISECNLKIKSFLKNSNRKKIVQKSLKNNGLIIYAKNKKKIIECANIISPEHLEILTKDFRSYKNKITNAGSIGLGKYSPVASSDYAVGVNHVLGCYGSSKYASGLNLSDFYKKYSQFELTKSGIESISKTAIELALYENLSFHALSIKSRLKV